MSGRFETPEEIAACCPVAAAIASNLFNLRSIVLIRVFAVWRIVSASAGQITIVRN
jgi:hypothetical protein